MGRRIKAAIDGGPVNQAAVALAFDITEQAVSGWIKTGKVDKRKLPQLAKLTGVPLSYFLPDAPEVASQSVSITAEIVLAAVALAKKTIGLTGDDSFDPAEDPETFAQAINVVLAAAKIQGKGDVDGPAQRIGKAGRSGRAAGEAKAGPAVEPARGQRRKSASGSV